MVQRVETNLFVCRWVSSRSSFNIDRIFQFQCSYVTYFPKDRCEVSALGTKKKFKVCCLFGEFHQGLLVATPLLKMKLIPQSSITLLHSLAEESLKLKEKQGKKERISIMSKWKYFNSEKCQRSRRNWVSFNLKFSCMTNNPQLTPSKD